MIGFDDFNEVVSEVEVEMFDKCIQCWGLKPTRDQNIQTYLQLTNLELGEFALRLRKAGKFPFVAQLKRSRSLPKPNFTTLEMI
jgi:hypothetical protein